MLFHLRPGVARLFRLPLRSRTSIHADIDEELAFHFAHRVEENRSAGMSDDEARAAARAQFGDVGAFRAGLIEIDTQVARQNEVRRWLDALQEIGRASCRERV